MNFFTTVLPFLSSGVSLIFAGAVLRRFIRKRGAHHLLWGIGMLFYAIGGFCEGYYGAFGWNPLIFRLWYLFGAMLVAAWLGQGTAYLLIRKRGVAHALMAILALGSLYGAWRVFGAELNPALMTGGSASAGELSGRAIVTPGVRTLTPFFNLYGTVLLVGGAAYSAWLFWRKRVLLHRTIGNVLIALGALSPAFGGAFSRMGIPGALYISEFIGAVLLFAGFLRATTPLPQPVEAPRASQTATS